MALITKTYTFSAGSTIIASEHNTNFDTIYNEFNGSISNANISGTAGISYSKLSLSGQIVNSDIASNAAIAGSKIYPAFVGSASVAGNVTLSTAGNKFLIKQGVNASLGTAVLAAGIITSVANTLVTANSKIFLTTFSAGGTVGVHYVSNVTAGATFNINSSQVGDTSTIGYLIIEPA